MTTLAWWVHTPTPDPAVERLCAAVAAAGWPTGDPAAGALTVVWADHPLGGPAESRLAAAHRPLLLLGPTVEHLDPEGPLAEETGLLTGPASPVHELRVRPGPADTALGGLLGEPVTTVGRVHPAYKVADDVDVLLTAHLGRTEHPVSAWRPSTWVGVHTLTGSGRDELRLLLIALHHATRRRSRMPVRVGLLGFGAIGHEHLQAVQTVPGLEPAAVCDRSAHRLAAATTAAPQLRTTTDPAELLDAADVDLVVVSTPPDSHAAWALRVLESGRHVVVEKPFALTTTDADEVLDAAEHAGRLAVVYQNRRFDPDHRALQRLRDSGTLGELFHVEAFVGGYQHPCNYWHSDEHVSGGAVYDWGAHLLDQLLDLLPGHIEHVTAAEHKLVWHDVTNADHSRVTVRFDTGAEAHLVHSDLAAALKPRWYVLGTRGAVVGHWRTERVLARSDVGTLVEDVLAPADTPPRLVLHAPDGSVTELAAPVAPAHGFHRELADHLHLGLPMSVTGQQSRRVVAVLEAARASARAGGTPVVPR